MVAKVLLAGALKGLENRSVGVYTAGLFFIFKFFSLRFCLSAIETPGRSSL
jgi:hypothetical protein